MRLKSHLHLVVGSAGVMISTAVSSIAGWLFWMSATHHWGARQIGIASSLVAVLTTVALVAGQPIATTLLRRLPRNEARTNLFEAGAGIAGATAGILATIAVFAVPSSLDIARTPAVGFAIVLGAIAGTLGVIVDASSLAVRRPQLMVVRNGAFGVGKLALLLVVALPVFGLGAPAAVVGSWAVLSAVVTAIAIWRWLAREHERAPRAALSRRAIQKSGWGDLRGGLGPQILGTLGGSLPPVVLPIVVVVVLGPRQTAFFSVTWLVGGLCFMISPSVCQALLAEGSHEPSALAASVRAASLLSLGLLVVPVLLFTSAGAWVLGFFGPSYAANGVTLLAILALSALPDLVTNIGVARFRVLDRLWHAAGVNVTIAIVTLALTPMMLSHFGINGAGWAWMVGQTSGCIVLAMLLWSGIGESRDAATNVRTASQSNS